MIDGGIMSEKEKIKNVAVYFRYSSDQHDQKANSELRQLNDIRAFCYKRDYNIVWVDGDEETPGWTEKPKLNALKELCKDEISIDALVVTEFSRLTRKDTMDVPTDIKWLRDLDIKLIFQKSGEIVDLSGGMELMMLQMRVFAGRNCRAATRSSEDGKRIRSCNYRTRCVASLDGSCSFGRVVVGFKFTSDGIPNLFGSFFLWRCRRWT